jgi:GH25 family lysozyme M1 (1,4-beta-N-acetylmuramidase)
MNFIPASFAAPLRAAARAIAALLCGSALLAAPPGPAAADTVQGIDVSVYNGDINWAGMPAEGIRFAFLRATESTYLPDAAFSNNVAGATARGIAVGAYHFATPLFSTPYYQSDYDRVTTPESEADNFLAAARGAIGPGFLPPVLDIEAHVAAWTVEWGWYVPTMWVDPLTGDSWDRWENPLPKRPGMGAAALAQWVKQWANRVRQQTNVMPILYTDLYHATALAPHLGKFMKLWISDIERPAGSPAVGPLQNWNWLFHQYSWTGSLAGNSPIDRDVFNGGQAAYDALVKGEATDRVTLTVAGSGSGNVGSSPAGLACSASCSASYKTGSTVTLWATPDYGAVFTGWSGDCSGTGSCVLDMTTPKEVTATFGLPPSQPVYRFYNSGAGGHFFTIVESEKNAVVAGLPTFRYEGIGFNAFATQVAGSLPVYRFFNSGAGGHFFTINEGEKATVIANYPSFRYEGIGFYAYPSQMAGALPVYRFFNSGAGGHFFTLAESEKNAVMAGLPSFRYEGIGFFARPPAP